MGGGCVAVVDGVDGTADGSDQPVGDVRQPHGKEHRDLTACTGVGTV